jgi:prepilin peptidase CpaA
MFLSGYLDLQTVSSPRPLPRPRLFQKITMFILENYFLIGAVLVASLGGVSDARSARIPNWLTYSGLVVALVLRFALLGWVGLKSGAVGLLVAGGIFLILFVMGAMGGGDLKLMACVGAWAGSAHVIAILLAAALAGGVLAIFYVFFRQGVRTTLWNLFELIRFRLTSGLQPHPLLDVREAGTVRVPFGVAIAMGTLFCAGNAIWWR